MLMGIRIVFLLLLVSMFYTSAFAATYYVRSDGHDIASGINNTLDETTGAWLTIQKAADTMVAGDVVEVQAGTYNEYIISGNDGSVDNYITFHANGTVTIEGFNISNDWIKIDGFDITGDQEANIKFTASNYLYVVNCIIRNGAAYNRSVGAINFGGDDDAHYATFISNIVYGFSTTDGGYGAAIHISGTNHAFINNTIHTIDTDVFRVFGSGHVFRGNEIYNITDTLTAHSDLFQSFNYDSYDILIENNYFHDGADTQVGNISGDDGSQTIGNWTFRNNVFVNIWGPFNIGFPDMKFYNNIFVDVDQHTGGALIFGNAGPKAASGGQVFNNVFISCGVSGSRWYWTNREIDEVGFAADYNYVAQSDFSAWGTFPDMAGQDSHGVDGGNPQFEDFAGRNYHFLNSSVLLDAGTAIATFEIDKDGVFRPQGPAWDIGAYEFQYRGSFSGSSGSFSGAF